MPSGFDAAETVVQLSELAQEHIFNTPEVGFLHFPVLTKHLFHVAAEITDSSVQIADPVVQIGHTVVQIADAVVVEEYADENNDHGYRRADCHGNVELGIVHGFSVTLDGPRISAQS